MKIKLFKKKKPEFKQVTVGNFTLWANYEHPIQEYLKHYKYYSRNLARIAKYIETKYPQYNIIDVGANIADTVALLRTFGVDQQVYLIEGEPAYFNLMQRNLPQFSKVKPFQAFLGETNSTQAGGIQSAEGTARLNLTSEQQTVVQKLDDLAANENFENVKLLKIDTDGFDFKILRGSLELIARFKPVLFFEYDAVFLEEQSEHSTDTIRLLQGLGYSKIIYYDNYGKMLLSTTLNEHLLIDQLYIYMRRKDGAFPYFDVCIFHEDDDQLADQVIQQEMKYYNEN